MGAAAVGIKPAPFSGCSSVASSAPVLAPARAGGPQVKLLTPSTPHLLQKILTAGYIGTILPDCDILSEALKIGKGRREAAEAGTHRKSAAEQFSLSHDVKGAAGEVALRWLLREQIAAGIVITSASVAEAPDKSPDLAFFGLGCEAKTNGRAAAFSGYYNRDDRFMAANVRQVASYIKRGIDQLLFVYFEGPSVVHLFGASPVAVANWPVEAYLGSTPFYKQIAADRLPLGQLMHTIGGNA